MSDTDSPPSSFKKKALGCLVVLLLMAVACVAYVVHADKASRSDKQLEFAPFRYRPLEKSYLTAKFELNELPARLLGGPTEVKLNERELNALLFGDLHHEEGGEKARVLIEGDTLRFEISKPIDDTPDTQYYNVTALVKISMGPDFAHLELLEGQVGEFSLGPITRPMVETKLREGLAEKYKRDARLNQIRAMSVSSGQVILTYEPGQRR